MPIDKLTGPTTDVHIPKMPLEAYRIAKGAATIAGEPVRIWIAKAILEKWERETNYGAF